MNILFYSLKNKNTRQKKEDWIYVHSIIIKSCFSKITKTKDYDINNKISFIKYFTEK